VRYKRTQNKDLKEVVLGNVREECASLQQEIYRHSRINLKINFVKDNFIQMNISIASIVLMKTNLNWFIIFNIMNGKS
jgi:hypothetical protein